MGVKIGMNAPHVPPHPSKVFFWLSKLCLLKRTGCEWSKQFLFFTNSRLS